MSYNIKDVVHSAKQVSSNWYEQRTVILKFLEAFMDDYPDKYSVTRLYDGKIQVISFGYNGEVYFWWDGIDNGRIECCGLEKAIDSPQNGKVLTTVLWCSDPDDKSPQIPRYPIKFA